MEEFRDYEYRGRTYKVGNRGTIIGSSGKTLKKRINEDGYEIITMGAPEMRDGRTKVHRIVATVFCENPNPEIFTEVNHIDFNRTNNDYRNLEWVSHVDNIKKSAEANRYKGSHTGEKNGRAILTENDVKIIKSMIASDISCLKIARDFNVGASTIYNIKLGNTWKGVE